jgi:hypothetical protein
VALPVLGHLGASKSPFLSIKMTRIFRGQIFWFRRSAGRGRTPSEAPRGFPQASVSSRRGSQTVSDASGAPQRLLRSLGKLSEGSQRVSRGLGGFRQGRSVSLETFAILFFWGAFRSRHSYFFSCVSGVSLEFLAVHLRFARNIHNFGPALGVSFEFWALLFRFARDIRKSPWF